MKNLAIIAFLFLAISNLTAQFNKRFAIEANLARYSKTIGIFDQSRYMNSFNFHNGANVVYEQSKNINYIFGAIFIKQRFSENQGITDATEFSEAKGIDLRLGVRYNLLKHKRIYPTIGLELFGELTNHLGILVEDPFMLFRIDHKSRYLGIAPSLSISIRVIENIDIFIESRYKVGRLLFEQKLETVSGNPLVENIYKNIHIIDPLNGIGVRFRL